MVGIQGELDSKINAAEWPPFQKELLTLLDLGFVCLSLISGS